MATRRSKKKSRTSVFNRIVIIVLCLALLLINLFIGINFWTCKQIDKNTDGHYGAGIGGMDESIICYKPECIKTASRILSNIDFSIDPCDNFYKFVCNGFLNNTVIPDGQQGVSAIKPMIGEMLLELKLLLQQEANANDTIYMNLTRMYYQSCMNTYVIDEKGLQPLMITLENLGGWPLLLEKWNESSFDWKESMYRNRRLGHSTDHFLSLNVAPHPVNSSQFIISIEGAKKSDILQSQSNPSDNEQADAHLEYMIEIAKLLGGIGDTVTKDLNETLSFERSLYNISAPESEMKYKSTDILYDLRTIRELSEKHPSIPWLEYINTLLAPVASVTEDDFVSIAHPNIKQFEELIEKTPKRVQANYALWRVVYDAVDYLTYEIRSKKLIASLRAQSPVRQEDRWEKCTKEVTNSISLAVGALYSKKSKNRISKEMLTEMFFNLRQEMEEMIRNANWMDKITREAALEKINSMRNYISYPDEVMDEARIEDLYKTLELSPDSYLQNKLNCSRFLTDTSYGLLKKPVEGNEWLHIGFLTSANAHYFPALNQMIVSAGILLGVMFNADRPRYMNYGSTGYMIGHEITHGFDTSGSQYGPHGGVINWWQNDTRAKFKDRVQCVIDQYGNYTHELLKSPVNGEFTQGENVADNGGIKAAYRAYEKWTKTNGAEPMLPGLNYSPQQMFWISSASFFCVAKDVWGVLIDLMESRHSPAEFRIRGSLSNMPEFARDFQCPKGSKMNPENRCSVW
ncbi:hypothetical protein QAD02_010180 [Eretmocerus hayati]|uniref:Uncharacterized protein n=1 Tax=Eretmocerus hayati TaxID=131215 RepID=A0ACC2NE07_9HYME|nr:hypothetical protein QAD02_010180 [Eretmocerus hayati]